LDSYKAMLELVKKRSGGKIDEDNYVYQIDALSKELGLNHNEPDNNYMAIRAYCKEELFFLLSLGLKHIFHLGTNQNDLKHRKPLQYSLPTRVN